MTAPARFPLRSALVFLAALAAASPASAQDVAPASVAPADTVAPGDTAAGTLSLTLADVVRRARQDPPSVLSAMASAGAADAQVALVHAALLPSLSVSFGLSSGLAVNPLADGQQTSLFAPSAGADAGVSMRWTIWDFGRNAIASGVAGANARAARDEVRAAERSAMAQAASAYYVLLADGELIESLRTTVAQREREFEIARRMVASGSRAPVEQTRAELALAAARLDVTSAEIAARTDTATLALSLGIDPAETLAVVPPSRALDVDDNARRAATVAEQSRPEVAALQSRLAASVGAQSLAGAAYRPSLVFTATGGASVDVHSGADAGPRNTSSIGIGISIPLFDPSVSANRAIADANVSRARAALDAQVLAVRAEAVQAAEQVRAARQSVAQSEQLAQLAAANLAQAQGRYEAGAAPFLEMVDAQSADQGARVALVRARFQLELARVRLLAAVGRVGELETTG